MSLMLMSLQALALVMLLVRVLMLVLMLASLLLLLSQLSLITLAAANVAALVDDVCGVVGSDCGDIVCVAGPELIFGTHLVGLVADVVRVVAGVGIAIGPVTDELC